MRNYQHFRTYYIWSNILVKCLEKIVSCYPQSDASDGTVQLALLFLVLMVGPKPWNATNDAAEATGDFLHFFFLIKNMV